MVLLKNLLHSWRSQGRLFRDAGLGAIFGVITALGEPGIGIAPLFPLGLIALSFLAIRARSYAHAVAIGAAYATVGAYVCTVAARSWGPVVPVALAILGGALYGIPLAVLSRWVSRRFEGVAGFCASVAVWALCIDVASATGFPIQGEALCAVAAAPFVVGGARICGTGVICGLMIAGTIGAARELARAANQPARATMVRAARPLLVSLALLLTVSAAAHLSAPPSTGRVSVGVPQMNVPSRYFKLRQAIPNERDAFESLLSSQLTELSGVDLVAFSETFDGAYSLQLEVLRKRFQSYAELQHQALLVTSYLVAADGGGYNAVGAIDPNGHLVGIHRKVDLAPFGEMDLERGPRFSPLRVLPDVRVGALICQEALLGDGPRTLARGGANLLVTPTSDVSFGSGTVSFEHLAGARLRALEVGRTMIWASAAGPSGAIDRWGNFSMAAPFRKAAAARMQAELHEDLSPFVRTFWFWPVACLTSAVLLGLLARSPGSLPLTNEGAIGTLSGIASFGAALAFGAATSTLTPGAVEVIQGSPERARSSILELMELDGASYPDASLERFRTSQDRTASGAMAYFLDFYGLRSLPSNYPVPPSVDINGVARDLNALSRVPTRTIRLDSPTLRGNAVLVRTRAGQFGVLTTNGKAAAALFLPARAAVFHSTLQDVLSQLEPEGLLPASDSEIDL